MAAASTEGRKVVRAADGIRALYSPPVEKPQVGGPTDSDIFSCARHVSVDAGTKRLGGGKKYRGTVKLLQINGRSVT